MRHDVAAPAGAEGDGAGRRVLELDALRGLACVVILVYHLKPNRIPGGWAAVDMFFILSGFLITSLILKHHNNRRFLFNFYMRRGLRLWPIYYLTVLLVAAAVPILPRPYDFAGLPYVLTYTQNIPRYWSRPEPLFTTYLSHTWSLAVEEQFYLLWPLLLCRLGRRGVVPLCLALVAAAVWARTWRFHWWLLLARGDGLALGALLAVLLPDRGGVVSRPAWLRQALGATGLAAAAYLIVLTANGGMSTLGKPRWPALTLLVINLLGFAVIGLVLCHEGRPALRLLRNRWLVGLGNASYGLYMYHYVVLLMFDDVARQLGMRGRPVWRELLAAAVIVALAALSWRYVERPLLRLKAHFSYAPRRATSGDLVDPGVAAVDPGVAAGVPGVAAALEAAVADPGVAAGVPAVEAEAEGC